MAISLPHPYKKYLSESGPGKIIRAGNKYKDPSPCGWKKILTFALTANI
jgi:hypothetical protein